MDSLKGKFLVAAPRLADPNFDRTVVLICEHNEQGALGLIVNRTMSVSIHQALPDVPESLPLSTPMFEGGPVHRDSVSILHSSTHLGGTPVADGILFGANRDLLARLFEAAATEITAPRFRLYAGYSGWGEGQLESEMTQGSWIVAEARMDHILSPHPESMWNDVLRDLGGKYVLVSMMPRQPELN